MVAVRPGQAGHGGRGEELLFSSGTVATCQGCNAGEKPAPGHLCSDDRALRWTHVDGGCRWEG